MLQSVELFSGSGAISEILATNNYKTFTIDFDASLHPDLCIDILDLELKHLPGTVNLIWASPDCRYFSRAAAQKHWQKTTMSYRNYLYFPRTPEAEKSIALINKTIELIDYLKPAVWFIENPVGRLPHINSMRSLGHYRYAVNYQDWGFTYSKETYIFTNQLLPLSTTVPLRHGAGLRSINDRKTRSRVPPNLIQFLINHTFIKDTIYKI